MPPAGSGTSTDAALRQQLQRALDAEFALVRLLGRGGMGAVYLARELALDRLVAVKVLPPDSGDSEERRARFRREAQLAARLTHPNIVPLHSFGTRDGLLYYVMGYVRGESLAERLRRDGPLPPDDVRALLAQIADALEYAHGKGVIHRDIKPDNILLDDETGRPMLADFGIARTAGDDVRHGEAAGVVGTLHYMSPEQAAGRTSIDGRSDIYALGVVGYVMLTGTTPFTAATFREFREQQQTAAIAPVATLAPDTPADLAAAIMRSLEADPDRRWPDARALKTAVGASLDDDPDRLPGEVREIAGAVFYSLVVAVITLPIVSGLIPVARSARTLAVFGMCVAPISYAVTAAIHCRKGIAWRDLARASLWPPGWWPFWWPASRRRPWDLWHRLPPVVRRLRMIYGVIVAAMVAAIPFALAPAARPVLIGAGAAILYVVTGLMLFTAWWAYRNGIPNNADLRSLVMRSTSDRRFWKRPQLAQRLLPAAPRGAAATGAGPDYVRRLSAAAQGHGSGRQRELALRSVELARLASRTLDSRGAQDPSRNEVAGTLRDLCERIESLGTADDAQAAAVAAMIDSLEREFAGSGPEAGTQTLATGTIGAPPTVEPAPDR